jgi:L-asparagine transporter-like permease
MKDSIKHILNSLNTPDILFSCGTIIYGVVPLIILTTEYPSKLSETAIFIIGGLLFGIAVLIIDRLAKAKKNLSAKSLPIGTWIFLFFGFFVSVLINYISPDETEKMTRLLFIGSFSMIFTAYILLLEVKKSKRISWKELF